MDEMAVIPMVYNKDVWTDSAVDEVASTNRYVNRGDAILTVKGTLTATKSLAGNVYIDGGTVSVPSTTTLNTYEAVSISGKNTSAKLENYVTLTHTYNPITVS